MAFSLARYSHTPKTVKVVAAPRKRTRAAERSAPCKPKRNMMEKAVNSKESTGSRPRTIDKKVALALIARVPKTAGILIAPKKATTMAPSGTLIKKPVHRQSRIAIHSCCSEQTYTTASSRMKSKVHREWVHRPYQPGQLQFMLTI